jgi:serine/threonine-protein kinase
MATIHLGRQLGTHGFARLVAIKRLHPGLARDPHFAAMLLDEARLAARIAHPNVIPPLDMVVKEGELFLVLEYVEGESLSKLIGECWEQGHKVPMRVAGAIVADALYGLHAAHEAKQKGVSLDIVHRDVSPQNILVGVDGLARVFDFGLAKAAVRAQMTREGHVKGKLAYMAPEQLAGTVSRRTDIYAMGIVLWELIVGRYAFASNAPVSDILGARILRPGRFVRDLAPDVDEVVMRALKAEPDARYATALDMAAAVESTIGRASSVEVSEWVQRWARGPLAHRARLVQDIEQETGQPSVTTRVAPPPPFGMTASVPAPAPERAVASSRPKKTRSSRGSAPPAGAPAKRSHVGWIVAVVAVLLAAAALISAYEAGVFRPR